MPDINQISIIVDIISDISVVIITLSAGIIAYNQLKNANLRSRYQGTSDLFDRFNAEEQRANRRWVYQHCAKFLSKVDKPSEIHLEEDQYQCVEQICNYFDWVALNVKNKLMSEEDAIDIYGDSFVRCWVILQPWIKHKRKIYGQQKYLWKRFEEFSNRVISHKNYKSWKENNVLVYTPYGLMAIDYETSQSHIVCFF